MLGKRSRCYRVLLIAELICLLFLLFGCFREDELVGSFFGGDIVDRTTWVEDHQEFHDDRMSLTPGVYQIRVRTVLEEGQSIYVEMKYDEAYFHTLRGNGVSIFSGEDAMEFNVYLLDKVETAFVQCDFYNIGTEAIEVLEVYRTNQGSRILFFFALAAFGGLDLFIEFRRRILEGRVSRKQQVVFWTLAAGVLLAYFPFMTDYLILGTDTTLYLSRIADLPEVPAVSMFYGNVFLLIPAFLYNKIGLSIMAVYKAFVFVIFVLMAVVAYKTFYQCMKEEYAALGGSMIYLLMPYSIFNIYGRGALGECLAMVFLPLVCCGVYLLYTEDTKSASYRKYKWYVVCGVVAVIQSHLLSVEMMRSEVDGGLIQVGAGALMLLVIYVLWSVRTKQGSRLCNLLLGMSLLTMILSTGHLSWSWSALGALFVSMFAGFFFLRVKECGGNLIKTAVCVAILIGICSTVYHVDRIVFEAEASYLYTAESIDRSM